MQTGLSETCNYSGNRNGINQQVQIFLFLYSRKSLLFNNTQRQVFLSLFIWRDFVAREVDESHQFILPFSSLVKLAKSIPHATADLPRLLHPIPVHVRSRGREVIEIIQQACEYSGSPDGLRGLVEKVIFKKSVVMIRKNDV